jgi:asparagine synthase (glutamine-hydrolysing)
VSVQAGMWNLDGELVNPELLGRFGQTTSEFGPDGESIFVDGAIGMIYRPFHTTLESRLERQPHAIGKGTVITWDGRLDNRDELLSCLSLVPNEHSTDIAIVAAAFARWGTGCFAHLVGDWALVIWEPSEKRLILARDYLGIRHLFYYPKPRVISWCTLLSPLALCGDQFTLSDEYIASYLAFYPDAYLTPYREILSVPPGQFVVVRNGHSTVHRYWAFDTRKTIRYRTDTEYEEQYLHLFRQAVRRRLRTDSPILAELSGGLDSSSIVCAADDIAANTSDSVSVIDTFSYYDSNEPAQSDLLHFDKVMEQRKKTGFRVDLKGSGDSLIFQYKNFAATPGFGPRAEINNPLTTIVKQHGYRVMLSGIGGDELNGQPLDPCVQMAEMLLQFRVKEVVKHLTEWSLLTRRPWIRLFGETMLQLLPVSVAARMKKRGALEPWIGRTFARKNKMSARQLEDVGGPWCWHPSARDARQTLVSLSGLMTYRAPSTIEKRYPYLDQTFVEFMTSIPLDQLLRPGQRRSLMRRALAEILPHQVLSRKTKDATLRCYSISLQKHWDSIDALFLSPLTSRAGYVEKDRFHSALLSLRNGQIPSFPLRLLKALSLELWMRNADANDILRRRASPLTGLEEESLAIRSA